MKMGVRNKVMHYRVKNNISVEEMAKNMGVSNEEYLEFERANTLSRRVEKKLAEILSVTVPHLWNKHPYISNTIYSDDEKDQYRDYFGEVSISFVGGGRQFISPISSEQYNKLYSEISDIGQENSFVIFSTLQNQTVFLRKDAIADMHFAHEALDHYGPDTAILNDGYMIYLVVDTRDWEIIEELEYEEPNTAYSKKIRRMLDSISEDHMQEMFSRATNLIVRLSNGVERKYGIFNEEEAFESLDEAVSCNFDGLMLDLESMYYSTFINLRAVDYIIMPTHKCEQVIDKINADDLEIYI